jgi:hypothetical protein
MKKRNYGKVLQPLPEREIIFRGVRFFTRNLGATEPMHGKWVWFAVGSWTHDQADGVFSDLTAAIADRFNIWEHLGLSFMPKFREPEQLAALAELEAEIALALEAE